MTKPRPAYALNDFLRVVAPDCCTVDDIAERVGCSRTTAGRFLARAELAGHVTISRPGLVCVVELTPAGRARLDAVK